MIMIKMKTFVISPKCLMALLLLLLAFVLDRPIHAQPMGQDEVIDADGGPFNIEKIYNATVVNGAYLGDQVLTGSNVLFKWEGTYDLPAGHTSYYLRWSFMGTTSPWFGPLNGPPKGGWNFPVPADAKHKLDEPVSVEARLDSPTGTKIGGHTSNVKVLFDKYATNDTHKRPTGNTEPNWFRHWGADADGAVPGYRSSGTITYKGKPLRFEYRVSSGTTHGETFPNNQRFESNGEFKFDSFTIVLYNLASTRYNYKFESPAVSFVNSRGVAVTTPVKKFAINNSRDGIDHTSQVVAHELTHATHLTNWLLGGVWRQTYGKWTRTPTGNDADNDNLPNRVEDSIGTMWNNPVTFSGFPISGGRDNELAIESQTQGATSIDAKDWSFPGKQSTPKY